MSLFVLPLVGSLLCANSPVSTSQASENVRPKLVLQITVDQLRGDLPLRMHDRLGEGGLRYLLEQGANYVAANYAHGVTMTAPGHATLFTGANPRENGIISNEWFDQGTGRVVYNCEDTEHARFGEEARARVGSSPKLLLSSTIGDELVLASGGKSRMFAVSVKDRGAILPAGHHGKAFWFSTAKGQFGTSDYYYDELPAWVAEWNALGLADAYSGTQWELMADPASYSFVDDRPFERGKGKLGNTFPKSYGDTHGPRLYSMVAYSPAGDELTASFAQRLIDVESIGQGEYTDFLAVSFSSADYVGHAWGPSSVEAEDNILRLDRSIAALLKHVDERVGLANTLIVLCADHGAPDAPQELAARGRDVGWVDDGAMLKAGNRALKEHFGIEASLIRAHLSPYLYLDFAKIAELELDPREVSAVLARSLESQPGIAHAISRWQLEDGTLADSPMARRLQASFYSKRSGDLWLVNEPQWLIGAGNPKRFLTSIHGSPWNYDTHVPILFVGAGIEPATITRAVSPRDIAPTLAAMLGINAPDAATGEVLHEVADR